jgi:hypothetical protein
MTLNPKKLFLIDVIGAIISAVMLGIVLVKFEDIFGMPKNILYLLSVIPSIFAIYSFICFLRVPKKSKIYLKIIALLNLLYCFITLSFVIYLYKKLTFLGVLYFVLELIIIVIVIILELKTATKHNN